MRSAIGPFLTTGIALGTAIIVVAHPVAPPSSEMQISTTQLSSSPGPLIGSFDKSLLNSIAGGQAANGAFAAVAKMMAALAAQADRINQEVASQTAIALAPPSTVALYKPTPNPPTAAPQPGTAAPAPLPNLNPAALSASAQQALATVVNDGAYLGSTFVDAAVATINLLTNAVPGAIVRAVNALIHLDPLGFLNAIVDVLNAILIPFKILFGGIANLLSGKVPTAAAAVTSPPAPNGSIPASDPPASTPDPVSPSGDTTPVNNPVPRTHSAPQPRIAISTTVTDRAVTTALADVSTGGTATQDPPADTGKPDSSTAPAHHTSPLAAIVAHVSKALHASARSNGQPAGGTPSHKRQ